jgi:RimJ/RimL family protein N-acetyltransferase
MVIENEGKTLWGEWLSRPSRCFNKRTAEIGYWIGEPFGIREIATIAVNLIHRLWI